MGEMTMTNTRDKNDQLKSLYDLRDTLLKENNNLVFKCFSTNLLIQALNKQPETPQNVTKKQEYKTQLSDLRKQYDESFLEVKCKEVNEKIKVAQTEVFGRELPDDPANFRKLGK